MRDGEVPGPADTRLDRQRRAVQAIGLAADREDATLPDAGPLRLADRFRIGDRGDGGALDPGFQEGSQDGGTVARSARAGVVGNIGQDDRPIRRGS